MKCDAPAAERNLAPIWAELAPRLPETGLLLEIASGSGHHAAHFARARPSLTVQPTDPSPTALASIEAWRAELQLENLRPALELDATRTWPVDRADAVFCCNMIHISPWVATEGLFRGAGRILSEGGRLFTYGPYLVDGRATTDSNAAFDASLRGRNPAWGLRDLQDLERLGKEQALRLRERLEMPANNFLLVFQR